MEKCIGYDNKEEINRLRHKIDLLNKEVEHLKSSMVKEGALHDLEMKINAIEMSIKEMRGNAKEDRAQIAKLAQTIESVNGMIEEHIENNAKLLAGQIVAEQKNEIIERSINELAISMKEMNKKIEEANLMNQLKIFYEKNVFNKWIMRLAILLLVIFIVAIFTFFTSGGETTFFDILTQLKELIT